MEPIAHRESGREQRGGSSVEHQKSNKIFEKREDIASACFLNIQGNTCTCTEILNHDKSKYFKTEGTASDFYAP